MSDFLLLQSGAKLLLNAISGALLLNSSQPTPDAITGGGFFTDHHKKYREYLEKLAGIRKKEDVTKKDIAVVRKIAKAVKIEAPEIKIAARQKQPDIDYTAVALEIAAIQQRIIALLEQAALVQIKKRQEEEAALVLLLTV